MQTQIPSFLILMSILSGAFIDVLGQPLPGGPPNILVIMTDDQGYADMGCFGAPDLQTPYMDSLVASGMRFNNFYANCPVCSPTRASLVTGKYPPQAGVPGVIRTHPQNNWGFLDPSIPTLPDLLNKEGYHTALIGKWHLGLETPNTPNERGFTYFKGWLGDMMDDYVEKRRHGFNYMRENDKEIDPPGHATDIFTDWAVEYLEDRKDKKDPFFLFLAYNAPHFPVQPPEDWLEKVQQREPQLSEKRAKLVAFIEHLDEGIGEVMKVLKETGLSENTLIIFTSDNGGLLRDEANNGSLRDGKQSVYEGGVKVPTCAVWPDKIEVGSRSLLRALTMDIVPTLLAAAGVSYQEEQFDGQSFLPTLLGEHQNWYNRPVFFSRREGGTRYGGKTIEAIRMGDWKLLQNDPFGARELYNIRMDPSERTDVIERYPEKFKELNALLMKHLQEGGKVPWQGRE